MYSITIVSALETVFGGSGNLFFISLYPNVLYRVCELSLRETMRFWLQLQMFRSILLLCLDKK